jgi:hypothetical protein
MKTTEIIERTIAENQHLLQRLFKLAYQTNFHQSRTSANGCVSIPLILSMDSPAKAVTGKVVRAYQPELDGVLFECLGLNEIQLAQVMNHPMISIFGGSIEHAAKCMAKQQQKLSEGDIFFKPTVEKYIGRIAVLTHLFHTAQWIIDDVYQFRASQQPNDIMRNDAHETFKKHLACWFVASVVRHSEELRSIVLERIYSSEESRRIFETLDKGEAQTLEAFGNCASWKSSSLEILMALCHANCADVESVFRKNPHSFWWELSIQLFDHKLTEYGKYELRRVINQHFRSLRNKLPFAFLHGQFQLRN